VSLGPVSSALLEEVRTWVRQKGVVLWLDADDEYSGFVDALRAGADPGFALHAFRGSHLQLMLDLEDVAAGVEPTPVLVHLPGFNEAGVKATPLFELYAAGRRERLKLATLVQKAAGGQVPPEAIEGFRSLPGLTLSSADAWLAGLLDHGAGGLSARLRGMPPTAWLDALIDPGTLGAELTAGDGTAALWEQAAVQLGLPEVWRRVAVPGPKPGLSDLALAIGSWALAVEYVTDLRRAPTSKLLAGIPDLPSPVTKAALDLAEHLRTRHRDVYRSIADEAEGWLEDERRAAKAEDLGRIDTFRFEEDKVLEAAVDALEHGEWAAVLGWAESRVAQPSFWLQEEPLRESTWVLLRDAARLGRAVDRAGPKLEATSLEEAVAAYAERGAAVDRAHRELAQGAARLLVPRMPAFEALRPRLAKLRTLWRTWANQWANDFNGLCTNSGFLPPPELRQRTLFDDVVLPLTREAGKTAYFVVDALRYEMAGELLEAIEDTPATTARLSGRLAELPSVTEVGMNVLAPVTHHGRLRPALKGPKILGFASGEFRVHDPETRRRAMHDRVGGATCPLVTLDEVLEADSTRLKRQIAQAKLVVVWSREIDELGEHGGGALTFDDALRKLRAAWRLLREAGVRRFVITADHGFLLLDDSTMRAQAHGRKIDPKRRHVLSTVGADRAGEVRVPLSDLGYEDVDGLHLIFPRSTAVFDRGGRRRDFVHGGNSFQERLIPVLTVVHRSGSGGDDLKYTLQAEVEPEVAGMHCVKATLTVAAQGSLSFGGAREVELALRAPEEPGVRVELCSVRGGARLAGGAIHAGVDKAFEVFFKLAGPEERRVRVELLHAGGAADLDALVLDARFAVAPPPPRRKDDEDDAGDDGEVGTPPAEPRTAWLEDLPAGGVRQLFEHLAAHGIVTESEAMGMLGGARALRRFSREFEDHAAKAPFVVRVDSVGGVKRYVREGNNS